jgi:hypothetical protein
MDRSALCLKQSMAELATVCEVHFAECIAFLESNEPPPEPEPEPDDYCAPIFLGPDIGFANIMAYNDEDGSCTISMAELATTCAAFFNECISFLNSQNEPIPEPEPDVDYFTAAGWILMPADPLVAQIGSDEEIVFVSLLREELAVALSIGIDMVSVTEINLVPEAEGRVHVRFELTAPETEAAAVLLLENLIDQSTDPQSTLLSRDFTNAIELVAMTMDELQLRTCEPVFLGPDIGFVSVMEYHDSDGTCTLSMSELATTCSVFFAECIAFLQSSEDGDAPAEPEGQPEGCSNEYDAIHGEGQCNALLATTFSCEDNFCSGCQYQGYCDASCGLCENRIVEPEQEPDSAPECLEGHQPDCNGLCTDSLWIGDGFCDDPYEGHHLNCPELDNDGGDCAGGNAAEFRVDCLGHRAPASWFGDGACDNGIYQHNGHWINFNCAESGFDGGDCPGGLSHMECVGLIQDLDHCEASQGGNDCASDACVQAIEALEAGWTQCNTQLGLSRNILREFQLVCGECSPYPFLELCGLGSSFPDSEDSCVVEHCNEAFVPWFQSSFDSCQAELTEIGAVELDLLEMRRFYESCLATFPPLAVPCDASFLGDTIGSHVVFELSLDNACRLNLDLLAAACGNQLSQCVTQLRSVQAVQADIDMNQQLAICPDVFLGPDVGFRAITSERPVGNTMICQVDFSSLVQACGGSLAPQCITFLDLEESFGQAPALPPTGQTFTVSGYVLLSADRGVLDTGSDMEILFVSLFRNDLAVATGVSMNMLSVVRIEQAIADEEGQYIHIHVSIELTAPETEDAASALLQVLIDQSTDPSSLLLQGSVTGSVEHVGEVRGGESQCDAVFLGPDIGFVNILEYHDEDGSCTISMSELAAVCSSFFAECLAFLDSAPPPPAVANPFVEPIVTASGTSIDDSYSTFTFSVALQGTARNVYTVYGTELSGMSLPAAYQCETPFGANLGGTNPAFWCASTCQRIHSSIHIVK